MVKPMASEGGIADWGEVLEESSMFNNRGFCSLLCLCICIYCVSVSVGSTGSSNGSQIKF